MKQSQKDTSTDSELSALHMLLMPDCLVICQTTVKRLSALWYQLTLSQEAAQYLVRPVHMCEECSV